MAAEAAPASNRSARARAWCFTTNNPPRTNIFPDGLPDGVKYVVYQLERGEQGTPHLQGYVSLTQPRAISWLKALKGRTAEGAEFIVFDNGTHFERSRGNPQQNKDYCTKPAGRVEGPWELGELPKQGERTDLAAAAASLMRDGDIRAIDPAIFIKYASGCLKLAALAPPPRRDDLKIITICGATGIGKSHICHDYDPDVYVVNMGNSGLWWDGYIGQKCVMFEEFKGQVQLQKMLQILDKYPLRLEIKGGLVPARFTVCFITSNYTPDKWYKNEDGSRNEELAALYRRLDIGDATAIPPRPDGPRFINVLTRVELQGRFNMLLHSGILPPKAQAAAVEPASLGPLDEAAAAAADVPDRQHTAPLSDSDTEPPAIKRHVANAHIVVPDAPADADMVVIDGEHYVRDDIVAQHDPSFFAPRP